VQAPEGKRGLVLEINGGVFEGRLSLEWTFSTALHRRSTIEELANEYLVALRELIAHCLSPQTGGYTPSDFSLADLGQEKLDELVGKLDGMDESDK
jgi:non-ribosomal peptide synthase protein (TIGR01720 family)